MITRKEYMADSTALHHAYYMQFATPATKRLVLSYIGKDRILASTDEHLNDITLAMWDRINESVRLSCNTKLLRAAEITTYANEGADYPPNQYPWSVSTGTCIAKAVAKTIKAEG
ncbi:MAG: hypothetical protein EOR11_19865 [Mesorhizobium sp.]|uniref:hypothetical protein n=1 Tax=Mesorhizobium sp. TaxID=1871066 RepID=UPI000FE48A48|nr:hypothetical protein [Mesorhizobium sp.]RWP84719.1 MAG: hypothetical protein EOR11_19865 [Mesorhizobium sp.]